MIERSRDYRRIKHMGAWDNLIISDDCYYLIESDGEKDLGIWLFHPHEDGLMVHVNFLKEYRGRTATQSAKDAFRWVLKNSNILIQVQQEQNLCWSHPY